MNHDEAPHLVRSIVEQAGKNQPVDLNVLTENASPALLEAVQQDPLSPSELKAVSEVLKGDVARQADAELNIRDSLRTHHSGIQKWGFRALALLVLAGGLSVYENGAKKEHAKQLEHALSITNGKVTNELPTLLTDDQEIVLANWLVAHPDVKSIDLKDTLSAGSEVLLNGSITYPFTTEHDSYPRKPNNAETVGISDTMAKTVVGKFIETNLHIQPPFKQRFDGALLSFLQNADSTIQNDKRAFASEYVKYVSDPDGYERGYLIDREKMHERFKKGPVSVADSAAMKLMQTEEFKHIMLPYLRKKYESEKGK